MLPYLTYGYWHTPYFFYTAIQDLVCTLLALWLTMMLWSFGRMVFWLYRFLLRGLYFFMILVTLISRSPCCSSSKSGSQARQECKSWYVTYIFDLVSLKAVILSTWFTSSGYLFSLKRDSAHLWNHFGITLQSRQKWSSGIFGLCSGPSGLMLTSATTRLLLSGKTRWLYYLSWNHRQ